MKPAFKKIKVVIIILCIGVSLNGYYAGNGSPCAFNENCPEGTSGGTSYASGLSVTAETTTLSYLIREGGGKFLQAIGDINTFLSKLERGHDYASVMVVVNSAISNIEGARLLYSQLIDKAATTAYNTAVIDKLIDFNYYGFRREKGLNPDVFEKVEIYLSAGDVRGVYNQFYQNTGDILNQLTEIKTALDAGQFPLEKHWRLSQDAAEAKLFGQYVAEVFFRIQ